MEMLPSSTGGPSFLSVFRRNFLGGKWLRVAPFRPSHEKSTIFVTSECNVRKKEMVFPCNFKGKEDGKVRSTVTAKKGPLLMMG